MRCFFVRRGSSSIAIDLHEDELRGIILLLHDIESDYPRLFHACPAIC